MFYLASFGKTLFPELVGEAIQRGHTKVFLIENEAYEYCYTFLKQFMVETVKNYELTDIAIPEFDGRHSYESLFNLVKIQRSWLESKYCWFCFVLRIPTIPDGETSLYLRDRNHLIDIPSWSET
jgi:hypothetical protein